MWYKVCDMLPYVAVSRRRDIYRPSYYETLLGSHIEQFLSDVLERPLKFISAIGTFPVLIFQLAKFRGSMLNVHTSLNVFMFLYYGQ